jgi:hypothetical protein
LPPLRIPILRNIVIWSEPLYRLHSALGYRSPDEFEKFDHHPRTLLVASKTSSGDWSTVKKVV